MRYAATMAALRPKRRLSNGGSWIGGRTYRTHSCLTVDENAVSLVKFRLDESNARDKVV